MKLFRFMSKEEFRKLVNGEELEKNKGHDGKTNSIGFCFMKDDIYNNPEYAYEYLSGIVSKDICVKFETEIELKKGYGIYADPYGSFFSTITQIEYSITKYNNRDFKILEFAIPASGLDDEEWEWSSDINNILNKLDEIEKKENEREEILEQIREEHEKIELLKFKDLKEFLENMQEERKMEIKIKDKYYKCIANIDEIEEYEYNSPIILKMSIILN